MLKVFFFSGESLQISGSPERLTGVLKAVFFLEKYPLDVLEALNV